MNDQQERPIGAPRDDTAATAPGFISHFEYGVPGDRTLYAQPAALVVALRNSFEVSTDESEHGAGPGVLVTTKGLEIKHLADAPALVRAAAEDALTGADDEPEPSHLGEALNSLAGHMETAHRENPTGNWRETAKAALIGFCRETAEMANDSDDEPDAREPEAEPEIDLCAELQADEKALMQVVGYEPLEIGYALVHPKHGVERVTCTEPHPEVAHEQPIVYGTIEAAQAYRADDEHCQSWLHEPETQIVRVVALVPRVPVTADAETPGAAGASPKVDGGFTQEQSDAAFCRLLDATDDTADAAVDSDESETADTDPYGNPTHFDDPCVGKAAVAVCRSLADDLEDCNLAAVALSQMLVMVQADVENEVHDAFARFAISEADGPDRDTLPHYSDGHDRLSEAYYKATGESLDLEIQRDGRVGKHRSNDESARGVDAVGDLAVVLAMKLERMRRACRAPSVVEQRIRGTEVADD